MHSMQVQKKWRQNYMKSNKIFALLAIFVLFAGISTIAAADNITDTNNVTNTGAVIGDDGNFVMSVPTTAGTGYHWEVSPQSYGVNLNSANFVADHPGTCGSSGTTYFNFHANSGDYYVKLVLISPTGDIVKEIDSDMLN